MISLVLLAEWNALMKKKAIQAPTGSELFSLKKQQKL